MKSYIIVVKILLISKKDNKKTNQKDHKKNIVKMAKSKMICPWWHLGQIE
jgi:hypothetical protein